MIIGDNRRKVIENIKQNAESGNFYAKVELNDPVLTAEQSKRITQKYLDGLNTTAFKFKTFLMRRFVNVATAIINKNTEIIGTERLPDMSKGMIITSNHFGPLENTIVRHLVNKYGNGKIKVVSQTSNFAMTGVIGLLMNYADTIPISEDPRYLTHEFLDVLRQNINNGSSVLIYPEQEMWFNYRKPRPPKRGAYLFAAKLGVPVLSLFVEIINTEKSDTEDFYKIKYRLHILGTLYPDLKKSVRDVSRELAEKDYALKCEAYERIYAKSLVYDFEDDDIAGLKK